MKVLHLPSNIASQISVTVRALRDIGIDARGLVLDNNPIQDPRGIEILPAVEGSRYSARGILSRVRRLPSILAAIRWADVVHWHFGSSVIPKSLDLRYIKFLNKTRIVEFWGSDIRIPEIASADNLYIAKMYEENPALALGAAEKSPQPFKIRQRIIISDYEPSYPDPCKRRPLIVHTPSNKAHGLYNIATGIRTSLQEEVEGIIAVFSPPGHPSKITYSPDKPDGLAYLYDISKAKRDLGYVVRYPYKKMLEDYKMEMNNKRFEDLFECKEQ
jgi:hypothetical protein